MNEELRFAKCDCCDEQVPFFTIGGVEFKSPCEKKSVAVKVRKEENAKQQTREYIEQLRRKIPKNFHDATFENDDGKDLNVTAVLQRFVDKFEDVRRDGLGLILYGPVGTGKTHMSMQIANALVERQVSVVCTSLIDVIKMAQDFDNADYWLSDLQKHKVIIIDDLGTHRSTQFADEQVYNFINDCYETKRVLIFTTNLTPSILQEASRDTANLAYARIYSRILERCHPVKCTTIRRAENQTVYARIMYDLLREGA